ncbi:UPF0161 protein At3g09310 isoform X2 [Asparagus officinalis]|uniref:UPF0161 protein At3g09310 isoform X2 n=1 Tax=Asparagus officinalis TaxID=4686 RepID=UPI00098E8474|nr:UPF0161 protein At3g09310 isoform X2 [Asparagus officinalis]
MAVAFAIPNPPLINLKNPLLIQKIPNPRIRLKRIRCSTAGNSNEDSRPETPQEEEVKDLGVRAALCTLRFYKREISPLLPSSCRFVPTCSEYSMEAYKKYGVAKGTILTAWRLCRCNPLGGSGFDPPRWFGEEKPSDQR